MSAKDRMEKSTGVPSFSPFLFLIRSISFYLAILLEGRTFFLKEKRDAPKERERETMKDRRVADERKSEG